MSSFDLFWRRKCLQYGLPDYFIQEEEEEREDQTSELLKFAYEKMDQSVKGCSLFMLGGERRMMFTHLVSIVLEVVGFWRSFVN